MRILVTGAGGMLGRDLVARANARGHDCVGVSHAELDVTDAREVDQAVARMAPEAIVNCAAWTDVEGAEGLEAQALAVNGTGAGNLARAAASISAHLVQVSTDYVFDGTATRPYVESDPTNALSAYGRTKLAGELEIAAASPEHAIVRTAWLFGPGGLNFVTTMLGLAAGGREELAVVTDEVGCPTYTGHLAPRLIEFAERRAAGIFHLAGSGHCSRNEFARAIFATAGLSLRVTETTQAQLAMLAPRPPWSVLASERGIEPLPGWRDGLFAYRESAPEVFGL
ncbi:MAG: dTDP-4-dehydrorhamnose reductase [Solirubrobacteraceae bacterium]|jgi:dTDP-4-dehydrorhamnose reductase